MKLAEIQDMVYRRVHRLSIAKTLDEIYVTYTKTSVSLYVRIKEPEEVYRVLETLYRVLKDLPELSINNMAEETSVPPVDAFVCMRDNRWYY